MGLNAFNLAGVDGKGFVAHLEAAGTPASQKLLSRIGRDLPRDCFVEIGEDGWILPGFVDTHSESACPDPVRYVHDLTPDRSDSRLTWMESVCL